MIRLDRGQTYFDYGALPSLTREFAETGCAMLPGFLAVPVLSMLMRHLNAARFVNRSESHHGEVFGTTDRIPATGPLVHSLHFLLNRRELFEIIMEITGCSVIGDFECRLHRTRADPAHGIDWHNDAGRNRIVGLNINLSAENHTGGLFELRDPNGTVQRRIKHVRAGDAFLFKIDREWNHRLTSVESGQRTVAVGWFRNAPDWFGQAQAWRKQPGIGEGLNERVHQNKR